MENKDKGFKKYLSGILCLVIIVGLFGGIGSVMGLPNMLNTIMRTAHDLLLNTVFYLMAICVITGALGRIFVEFGVVSLLERILRPLMKPLFNLPGVASLGAVMTFLSDNPAIISLAQDKRFSSYFKKFQLISLTNFGTAFGMGLLVIVFMISNGFYVEPFIGLLGAFIGCIVSTRLMQRFIVKQYPNFKEEYAAVLDQTEAAEQTEVKETSMFTRILNSLLDGGKTGVDVGLSIIPGVLIISTLVMILTFGPSTAGYTGAAYEGIEFLPWAAGKINFVFDWLFGFGDPHLIAFPITALGAVGAALGLVPGFVEQGWADGNAIAVFTAIGMCWSGYLSTHTAMLDALGYRKLTSKAILAHTIGGLVAGISAHWLYLLFVLLFGAPTQQDGGAERYETTTHKREVIAFEMVGDNQIRVGDRVFTDHPEDNAADDRSLANYIYDYLKSNTTEIGDTEATKVNVAGFLFDENIPEAMYESLYREVYTGFKWYKDDIAFKYFKLTVEELTDQQKAQLEEMIPFTIERRDILPDDLENAAMRTDIAIEPTTEVTEVAEAAVAETTATEAAAE